MKSEALTFMPNGDVTLRLVRHIGQQLPSLIQKCASGGENVPGEEAVAGGEEEEEEPDESYLFYAPDPPENEHTSNVFYPPARGRRDSGASSVRDRSASPPPGFWAKLKETAAVIIPEDQSVICVVSSQHMMLASAYFQKRLGGESGDAVTLKDKGCVTITTDDDPDTLIILLNIIHGRTRQVPRQISLELLGRLAVLVNYYGILESAEVFADIWIDNLKKDGMPSSFNSEVLPWLFIFWVFQRAEDFSDMARFVQRECDHDLEELVGIIPIPQKMIAALKKGRQMAIDSAITAVDQLIHKYGSNKINCKYTLDDDKRYACDAMILGSLMKGARTIGIWPKPASPFSGKRLTPLLNEIRSIKVLNICTDTPGKNEPYPSSNCHGVEDSIRGTMKIIEDGLEDLELGDYPKHSEQLWPAFKLDQSIEAFEDENTPVDVDPDRLTHQPLLIDVEGENSAVNSSKYEMENFDAPEMKSLTDDDTAVEDILDELIAQDESRAHFRFKQEGHRHLDEGLGKRVTALEVPLARQVAEITQLSPHISRPKSVQTFHDVTVLSDPPNSDGKVAVQIWEGPMWQDGPSGQSFGGDVATAAVDAPAERPSIRSSVDNQEDFRPQLFGEVSRQEKRTSADAQHIQQSKEFVTESFKSRITTGVQEAKPSIDEQNPYRQDNSRSLLLSQLPERQTESEARTTKAPKMKNDGQEAKRDISAGRHKDAMTNDLARKRDGSRESPIESRLLEELGRTVQQHRFKADSPRRNPLAIDDISQEVSRVPPRNEESPTGKVALIDKPTGNYPSERAFTTPSPENTSHKKNSAIEDRKTRFDGNHSVALPPKMNSMREEALNRSRSQNEIPQKAESPSRNPRPEVEPRAHGESPPRLEQVRSPILEERKDTLWSENAQTGPAREEEPSRRSEQAQNNRSVAARKEESPRRSITCEKLQSNRRADQPLKILSPQSDVRSESADRRRTSGASVASEKAKELRHSHQPLPTPYVKSEIYGRRNSPATEKKDTLQIEKTTSSIPRHHTRADSAGRKDSSLTRNQSSEALLGKDNTPPSSDRDSPSLEAVRRDDCPPMPGSYVKDVKVEFSNRWKPSEESEKITSPLQSPSAASAPREHQQVTRSKAVKEGNQFFKVVNNELSYAPVISGSITKDTSIPDVRKKNSPLGDTTITRKIEPERKDDSQNTDGSEDNDLFIAPNNFKVRKSKKRYVAERF